MNIFYLSNSTKECAQFHVDRHVTKMCIEYAQLLSTAHRLLDGTEYYEKTSNNRKIKRWLLHDEKEQLLMKSTHPSHPSAVWCRQSKTNYEWLYNLWTDLLNEYTYRYGKTHACSRLIDVLRESPKNIPDTNFTEPTPAMPDDVKVSGDSIQSYKNYYIRNKTHLASWKGKVNSRSVPSWFIGVN